MASSKGRFLKHYSNRVVAVLDDFMGEEVVDKQGTAHRHACLLLAIGQRAARFPRHKS